MMQKCPHHGLEKWLLGHTLYNGLLYMMRMTIDVAIGLALMNNPYDEAYDLIEDMAQNHYRWGSECALAEKAPQIGELYKISSFDHMNSKVDALYQKFNNPSITPAATTAAITPNCEICKIPGYIGVACQMMVVTEPIPDKMNYSQHKKMYFNTYKPGWRNHHNFSYKNINPRFEANHTPPAAPPKFQGQKRALNAPRKSNLEMLMENFVMP